MSSERATQEESTKVQERAMPQESTIWNERMPSLAHAIEQMLMDYGPFEAQLVPKNGQAYWAEVLALWREETDITWITVENTTIPGVRRMDEIVDSLFHVHPVRSLLSHPCPLCPLDEPSSR